MTRAFIIGFIRHYTNGFHRSANLLELMKAWDGNANELALELDKMRREELLNFGFTSEGWNTYPSVELCYKYR